MREKRRKALRLFVVRHGETADNVEMRYLGRRDEPLNDRGREQAARVAEALSSFPIGAVYTSPLIRAADTAARIGEACQADVHEDARLIEGSFGHWDGLTRKEVIQKGSPDVELLARWEADASFAPPGGESLEEIQARVMSLVEELYREQAGTTVALVSHVGPIKALLASAVRIPLGATGHLFLDPCSISVIDWNEHPFVRLFNSHAHLGWETPRWASF